MRLRVGIGRFRSTGCFQRVSSIPEKVKCDNPDGMSGGFQVDRSLHTHCYARVGSHLPVPDPEVDVPQSFRWRDGAFSRLGARLRRYPRLHRGLHDQPRWAATPEKRGRSDLEMQVKRRASGEWGDRGDQERRRQLERGQDPKRPHVSAKNQRFDQQATQGPCEAFLEPFYRHLFMPKVENIMNKLTLEYPYERPCVF